MSEGIDWSEVRKTQDKINSCMSLMRELGVPNSVVMLQGVIAESLLDDEPDIGQHIDFKDEIEELLSLIQRMKEITFGSSK